MDNVIINLYADIGSEQEKHKCVGRWLRLNFYVIATELYQEGEISSRKAAELADLPFEDFISELKNRKIEK